MQSTPPQAFMQGVAGKKDSRLGWRITRTQSHRRHWGASAGLERWEMPAQCQVQGPEQRHGQCHVQVQRGKRRALGAGGMVRGRGRLGPPASTGPCHASLRQVRQRVMQSPLFDEQQQQRQQAGQPAQVWGRWAEHTQRQGDGAGQSLWIVACRLTRYKWTAAARLLLADSRTYETRKTRLESMSLSSVLSAPAAEACPPRPP